MNGTREFRLVEFVGGPRDGETMAVDAGMDVVCVVFAPRGATLGYSDLPRPQLRTGEYRRRRKPHSTATLMLTELLIARSRVPIDMLVRMGLRGTEPTPYDWEGEE